MGINDILKTTGIFLGKDRRSQIKISLFFFQFEKIQKVSRSKA